MQKSPLSVRAPLPPRFVPGQRWISETEPELGLGTIVALGVREVRIRFDARGETRTYMHRNAPLRRVRLKPGDKVRLKEGRVFVVQAVREKDGLLEYQGAGLLLPEANLPDSMSFTDPHERLLAGQVGKPKEYALRIRTHEVRRRMLGSRVRGLAGARIGLLSHQLHIAHEVASRSRPRVLLADEVGLGKTIEAGLIFHRLHGTGQVTRVLIVTPEPLIHQWLVELYRRFNQMFTVLDEDLCRSEEKGDKRVNPFLARQTILCAADFLANNPRRVEQAREAGVDLLIVDEAHHLGWSPETASPAYGAIEALGRVSWGVILITATPIQLGQASHFGRLRLLDPDRFRDFDAYLRETESYQDLAGLVDRLLSEPPGRALDPQIAADLKARFPRDEALAKKLDAYLQAGASGKEVRTSLVEDLIDRHGTGRLMFRNRRSVMQGFPQRHVLPAALPAPEEHRRFAAALLRRELGQAGSAPLQDFSRHLNGPAAFLSGPFGELDLLDEAGNKAEEGGEFLRRAFRRDPRLDWLVDLLKRHEGEKVLLICSHKNVVFALQDILPTLTTAPFTSFHENLSLPTRDRNAAYFADEKGAQLLLSSEIGSEGRNFQFAHHLVLFDLPLNPSVLEQRIGRLDRIGQTSDIFIHVPYIRGTAQEVVYRWYEEGLNAFKRPLLGSDYFEAMQGEEVRKVCLLALQASAAGGSRGEEASTGEESNSRDTPAERAVEEAIGALVARSKTLAREIEERLEKGRDRLLEINSNRPALAKSLIEEIEAMDEDPDLEHYLDEVFDHFGLDRDDTAVKRGHIVFPGDHMWIDSFPGLPQEGTGLTYDRTEALQREELAFMSMDHPVMRGAVDLILSGQEGTVALVEWAEAPASGIALEMAFILEAAAPGRLHLDRFLPPTPIRVLVDAQGQDRTPLLPRLDLARLEMGPVTLLEEQAESFEALVPRLLDEGRTLAGAREAEAKRQAATEAKTVLGREWERLRDLRGINPSVSEAEVMEAKERLSEVLHHVEGAELRLDAVRLVLMGRR